MTVALGIIIVYMGLLVFISWVSAVFQRGKGAEGFLLADRQLPWPLVGVMIAGVAIGGSSTVGVAQNAYTAGLSAGWYNAAWALGPIFVGLFLARRMRASQLGTVNQMLGAVFGERFSLVSMVIQIIVMTVIISLQIVAGAAILTAILPDVFTMKVGILISALMFGIVATTGGLLAASLSNVVNLLVIYAGVICGVIAALRHYGGFENINAALPAGLSGDGSHWYDLTSGMGMTVIVAWFMTMLFQGVSNGGVLQNFIAAKTPEDARKGAFFGAAIMIPCGFLSAFFGIFAAAQFPALENSAMALPVIVMTLPGWVSGMLLAGLWAADISTATGLLVTVSTMLTQDVIFKYIYKTKNRRMRVRISRLVIAGVVLIAFVAAMNVASILGALMVALALFTPYSILLTAMFLAPNLVRRSSGFITLGLGTIAFVAAQFIEPALRIGGQTVYTVFIVSIIGFALCLLDKRPAPVERLYENAEAGDAVEG